jgi:hypothetical protein
LVLQDFETPGPILQETSGVQQDTAGDAQATHE